MVSGSRVAKGFLSSVFLGAIFFGFLISPPLGLPSTPSFTVRRPTSFLRTKL